MRCPTGSHARLLVRAYANASPAPPPWVSWSSDLAVMHAHQTLGPPRQGGAGHACEHHCAQHLHPCMYIRCSRAQRGIHWLPRVMHAAVRVPAYATYLVPGRVLPPVGIRPLWPRTLLVDSSRAHAPHRVAGLARVHETESLRRHAHVPETFLDGSVPALVIADCAVSRIPPRGLWLQTRLARVDRGIEIVQLPISLSHIGMRKEQHSISTPRTAIFTQVATHRYIETIYMTVCLIVACARKKRPPE